MRRIQRIVLTAVFIAALPVLAGCADFDMDKLDVFGLNEKKKLPGERKALFPEGVPGVTQGIPPEYLKENQQPPVTADQAPAAEAAKKTAAVEPEPKPKAKPRPKPRVTSKPTRLEMGQRPPQQQPANAPWPAPDQGTSPAPWPSAPPPGTFSR